MKTKSIFLGFISLLLTLSAALFSVSASAFEVLACVDKEGPNKPLILVVSLTKDEAWEYLRLKEAQVATREEYSRSGGCAEQKKVFKSFAEIKTFTSSYNDGTEIKIAFYCKEGVSWNIGYDFKGKFFDAKATEGSLRKYNGGVNSCSSSTSIASK
jgi:hypothetical protein